MVQGRRREGRGVEEGAGGEEMGMGYIANIGEVEQVLVCAELKTGFIGVVEVYDWWDELDVAWAEDS